MINMCCYCVQHTLYRKYHNTMIGNNSIFLAAILGLSLYSAVVEGSDCGCVEKTLKQHACSSEFGKFIYPDRYIQCITLLKVVIVHVFLYTAHPRHCSLHVKMCRWLT